MRLENEHTHYRARFEVFPFDNTDEVSPFVMQVLCKWVLDKEYNRNRYREMSPLYKKLEDSAFNYHEAYPDRISRGCYFSESMMKGLNSPPNYDGGAVRNNESMICTRSFSGENASGFPQFWAMDYDEPDSRYRVRRWHTSVGISSNGNTCIVNVRITNYLTPGFMGDPPEQPPSTTPNFVKELISLSGCQTCVGETVLHDSPIRISADNYQTDFMDNLLSSDRDLPMVVAVPTFAGEMPVDVNSLASKVLGIANVYVIDYENRDVKGLLNESFVFGEPSGKFHLGAGWVRVYEPKLSLESERDAQRHRFFRPDDIEEFGDSFNDMLTRSLTRRWFQDESDIIDVTDIDTQSRRAKNAELRLRLDKLGKRAGDRSDTLTRLAAKSRETQASNQELKAMVADQEELIDELRSEATEWEEIANSFASQVDSMTKAEKVDRKRVQSQIAGYEEHINQLKGKNASLDDEVRRLRYKAEEAQNRCEIAEERFNTASTALQGYESIEHIPLKLSEALDLIANIYPSRIIVLKEAVISARDFDGRYRLDDEWQILKSIPTVLWNLYFGDDSVTDLSEAYQSQTGFELALHEGSQTQKDDSLMRLRVREYEGKQIRVIAHIKGRDTSQRNAFRLHYHIDKVNRVIVIGHCGCHLKTAGTSRNT